MMKKIHLKDSKAENLKKLAYFLTPYLSQALSLLCPERQGPMRQALLSRYPCVHLTIFFEKFLTKTIKKGVI